MPTFRLIQALGLYMITVALFGTVRTGSLFPIIIMGSIGLITLSLGFFCQRGSLTAGKITVVWLAINVIVEGYQTFWSIPAHPGSRTGSSLIFGSVALFSLIVLATMLIRRYQRK